MAENKFLVDINLNQNELKQAVVENQAADPTGAKNGQVYYNSASGTQGIKQYKNGAWKKLADSDDLDEKVDANAAIIAQPSGKTIITYDEKGLVTGGSEIGIDSSSANYLEFDTTAHTIKAKVDTAVAENSTNLITSGAVKSAIDAALVGGVSYKGTWAITTTTTNFSGITLPVSKGDLFYVTGTGPATVNGIEWNPGDYLLVNENVASGGSLNGKVEKIDNTESDDIVRLAATQTLTNKTIDADDNTISDLTVSNLKSGVLQTTIRAATNATDTAIASEKAIRTQLDLKAPLASPTFTGTPTAPTAAAGTNTTQIATTAFVNTALSSTKFTATNPALTPSGGVCTWTISNTLKDADVIAIIKEASTGEQVNCNIVYADTSIIVSINSASNITAGTYKAVVKG